ncbi:E3 ubiquitin-protein ligase APD2 isoform X2 [Euphorbia lathyris]|uniref:E3 ubiquitin-protein ligase APD2 isoform X2 n=1 Tax=Euphorbia lathyris TaxID=212925 RepID=UPI0033140DC5
MASSSSPQKTQVSMTLILGVYGAVSVTIGPNSSVLIQPNPLFVQSIKVQELDSNPGLVLYGLYKTPSLNVVKPWSKFLNTSVPADSHKEWTYFMNEGSEINISYSVSPPGSSLFIIVAQGSEGLSQWLEDPTYPNTTLSWNVVHGSGVVQQKISKSSNYYVAVGNLNTEDAKVQLNLNVNALLYNTNEAYYKCTFTNGICSLSVLFPNGNSVVLTSPGSEDESTSDEWYIKVSYGPRWATYIVGIATMTVLMLGAFNFLNKVRFMRDEETGVRYVEGEPERAPLLSYKDDDLSSWGSSYDSVSNDDEDLENFLVSNSLEGKSSRDSENGNNTRRLCAICFDAPRDCFFLPCGHCVACFECGTRIVEAAGTCPVCGRNMKKVRKIFTV